MPRLLRRSALRVLMGLHYRPLRAPRFESCREPILCGADVKLEQSLPMLTLQAQES